ncbi:hypothetical protein FB1_09200 [Flavobacterium branchiophilum NBRC 15030 = ATCC 35035]|nr:hypothetical protein FB1_09200 [Flavobacterium branchiophilum NBRC 15030 = ATCC 35035]
MYNGQIPRKNGAINKDIFWEIELFFCDIIVNNIQGIVSNNDVITYF